MNHMLSDSKLAHSGHDQEPLIIDVREPGEYRQGHVKSAINLPLFQLMNLPKSLKQVPKDAKIILYCQTGNRSNIAMQILYEEGFTNLTNGINQKQIESEGY